MNVWRRAWRDAMKSSRRQAMLKKEEIHLRNQFLHGYLPVFISSKNLIRERTQNKVQPSSWSSGGYWGSSDPLWLIISSWQLWCWGRQGWSQESTGADRCIPSCSVASVEASTATGKTRASWTQKKAFQGSVWRCWFWQKKIHARHCKVWRSLCRSRQKKL